MGVLVATREHLAVSPEQKLCLIQLEEHGRFLAPLTSASRTFSFLKLIQPISLQMPTLAGLPRRFVMNARRVLI